MKGVITAGGRIDETDEEGALREAGIVSSAKKVKRYEIASYRRLRLFAELIGLSDAEFLPEVNEPEN